MCVALKNGRGEKKNLNTHREKMCVVLENRRGEKEKNLRERCIVALENRRGGKKKNLNTHREKTYVFLWRT